MKVISAHFVKSSLRKAGWPKTSLPEIAFAGRSNVGKSSLINSLITRHKLAKTSNSPGKTRAINFYEINGSYMFTDLPGYGFAKGNREEIKKWKPMIEEYLTARETLKGLVHIVDIRREPDELELMLAELVNHQAIAHILVVNKTDKLSRSLRLSSARRIEKAIGKKPILYSSFNGEGKKELWSAIAPLLGK